MDLLEKKTIISLMSGTSIDSIDALLVQINPDLSFQMIASHSLDYPPEIRKAILETANNNAKTADICSLNFVVGKFFAKCVNELLTQTGFSKDQVDFIASHGQTVFHIPEEIDFHGVLVSSTLQIGDLSVISELTGIMTIGDFRTKDMAAGGQGAPLVSFVDELLFKGNISRGILNIGGISNITVISPKCETFAFDLGPGNMLIDYFAKKLFDLDFDSNGEIAFQGEIKNQWLQKLLAEPYYRRSPPKTTGRELFSRDYAERIYQSAPQNPYDVLATISALTAKVIGNSYRTFILPKTNLNEIILGGGGAKNNFLIQLLKKELPEIEISNHQKYGIDDKLKEALAFAYLGYFTFYRRCNNLPSCTGARHPVVLGKITY
ncbi:MAG: anhydro-N-acetylmuramic acid kinase [Planctomycetia bacterium]|nr:anhydro-N-acetylmuramic acid kinase [Planctomycetia bacterium]